MSLRKILAIIIASFSFATACHPGAKRYHMRGQVMDKNVATNEITVDHEDIPGFMAAMNVPYKVKDPAVVQEVEPGDKIAADVVTTSDGTNYWLEDVRITDESGRKSTPPPSPPQRLAFGERVPSLPLVNQDGKTIHLDDFKGTSVIISMRQWDPMERLDLANCAG